MATHKRLGQHWLFDKKALRSIVQAGEITKNDTVLEVGPGLGTLTELLVQKAKAVVAVEKDPQLAAKLDKVTFARTDLAKKLEVIDADILDFDLGQLPRNYKVVANIPYYLTSNLLRRLLEAENPPALMALMVQKEVSERIVAKPGKMSILSFSVQYYAQPRIIQIVPKELFKPPPKVNSAIIQIKRRPKPYFPADQERLFRIVKAGFANKRKQLKNSLAAGLHLSGEECSDVLKKLGINPQARAQELSMKNWQKLYESLIS